MDNYNYPLGSDTPEAPWNQNNEEINCIDKKVSISISLSNSITISTNDYIPTIEEDYDVDIDPDGHRTVSGGKYESQDFSDTNWIKAYQEDNCYILTLLQEYGDILKKDIANDEDKLRNFLEEYKENPNNKLIKTAINILKNTLNIKRAKVNACYGYIVDDLEVFEE